MSHSLQCFLRWILGCSSSYVGLPSNGVEQVGYLKGSYMVLSCAGLFYYGHPRDRQKQVPRVAVDILFNQREFVPGLSLKVFVGLSPCGICFSGRPQVPFLDGVVTAAQTAHRQSAVHPPPRPVTLYISEESRHTGRTEAASAVWLLQLASRSNCLGCNIIELPWAISNNAGLFTSCT